MPLQFDTLKNQTITLRQRISDAALSMADRADEIPAGWSNNLRWQIGHLIGTPRLLTFGLLGEDLGIPQNYRTWFGKGTSPAEWGNAELPPMDQLAKEMITGIDEVFESMRNRLEEPFPNPYTTSAQVILSNPADTLSFSLAHDGIHLGLILALRRALAQAS